MSDFSRTDRISNQLHRCLSDILLRTPPRDPRVKPISILRVQVTPDLRLARIYFVPLAANGNPTEIQAGLKSAAGYIGRILGKELHMKYIPRLTFFVDDQYEQVAQVLDAIDALGLDEASSNDEPSVE